MTKYLLQTLHNIHQTTSLYEECLSDSKDCLKSRFQILLSFFYLKKLHETLKSLKYDIKEFLKFFFKSYLQP